MEGRGDATSDKFDAVLSEPVTVEKLGVSIKSLKRTIRFQYLNEPFLFAKSTSFRSTKSDYQSNNWFKDLSQFGTCTNNTKASAVNNLYNCWPDSPNPKRFKAFCSKNSEFVDFVFPNAEPLKIHYNPAVLNGLISEEADEQDSVKSLLHPMGQIPSRFMQLLHDDNLACDTENFTVDEQEFHAHRIKKSDYLATNENHCRLYNNYITYPYRALAAAAYYGLITEIPTSNDEESRYVQDQIMIALYIELKCAWSSMFDNEFKSIYNSKFKIEKTARERGGTAESSNTVTDLTSNEHREEFEKKYSHWIKMACSFSGSMDEKYKEFPVMSVQPMEIDPVLHSYLVLRVYKFASKLLCELFKVAEFSRVQESNIILNDQVVIDLLRKDTKIDDSLVSAVEKKLDSIYRDEEGFGEMWSQLCQMKFDYE